MSALQSHWVKGSSFAKHEPADGAKEFEGNDDSFGTGVPKAGHRARGWML